MPAAIHWLAFGGGADPPSNQVSIEQNLGLASSVLGKHADGVVLFAGGPGSSWVQEIDKTPEDDPVRFRLGEIFAHRADRATSYRPSTLPSHGAATAVDVLSTVDRALSQTDRGPLLIVVAAHGDPGAAPAESAIVHWGGQLLTARDLAKRLDRAPSGRPVRLVMSSCFSGGFAEIAFAAGDPKRGKAAGERCGLFASTWDREASGCDPDPDRRVQQGYSLYFYNALRGANQTGQPVERGVLDIDGDGRISLLEAHTRVRIASRSISVPTTTSERWLREVAPASGPGRPVELPEEDAVVAGLGRALAITDIAAARQRRAALSRQIDIALGALEELELRRNDDLVVLQLALLERWPMLDDPYHDDFADTVTTNRAAIGTALQTEPPALAYDEAQAEVDRLAAAISKLEVRLALAERLLRAYETRALAARLNAKGGAELDHYRALLACERSVIPAD